MHEATRGELPDAWVDGRGYVLESVEEFDEMHERERHRGRVITLNGYIKWDRLTHCPHAALGVSDDTSHHAG